MPQNTILFSNNIYKILSAIAISTLIGVFISLFLRFSQYQNSVNESKQMYSEYIILEKLADKYKWIDREQLQASLLRQNINTDRWAAINTDIDSILRKLRTHFKDEKSQLQRINTIALEQDKLFMQFYSIDSTFSSKSISSIKKQFKEVTLSLQKIDALKDDIVAYHQNKLVTNSKEQEAKYYSFIKTMVASAIVAILLLLISIFKLFLDKKQHYQTASFLENILAETNDIVNLYTPIYKDNKLIDFKIEYASSANKIITDMPVYKMVGKKATAVFPFLQSSGELEKIKQSFTQKNPVEEITNITIKGKVGTFLTRFFPSDKDIKIIISDITKLKNYEKNLSKLNQELSLSNNLLKEAEKIANMGSYIWFIDNDYTILSDNVYRILGYHPQEFSCSTETFKEFIHPDDIEAYESYIKDTYTNNKPIEFTFRVITKQNTIKHLYTNGGFSKYDGKTTMIGVIQDVTKKIACEQQLKQKNAELMHQNVELESFNRIACHDLQEPLRKVQMYLSRLSDDGELSKKNKQYIDRANDASSRMRTLINNLLSFSRINKKTNEFTTVNLNKILESVQEDLSLKIEESKANIQYSNLPLVNGIAFQVNQLFNNLIANAIKYRDVNKNLTIKITSKKLERTQIDAPFVKNHPEYYQLKVIDNGIGFDNHMSDKIFEVFQRLHQKHEYSGTGIGLAICKKIVTKHEGYIQATSIKGSGSVFTLYLPA